MNLRSGAIAILGVLTVAAGSLAAVSGTWAAVSKSQLLELVEKKVDSEVIVSLLEKECIDFEIDGAVVLEISGVVPKSVLQAAIECERDLTTLRTAASPPGTNAVADELSLSEAPPVKLGAVGRIAIVPLMFDGSADESLTNMFAEQVIKRTDYEVIDSIAMQVHFEDSGAFHSNAPLKSLLSAARAVGADAIITGTAEDYRGGFFGIDPGIRLDIKLVEVNRGSVLWRGGTQAVAGNPQSARRKVAVRVARQLPE